MLLAIERRSKPHESLNELRSKRNTITLTKGEVVADYVGDLISQVHSYKTDKKIFHIAIIDYLQGWTMSKKLERFGKMTFAG